MKNNKKILILQNKGNTYGGIWYVNKTIAEEFVKLGYEVEIVSVRNEHNDTVREENLNFKTYTINTKDIWTITHKSDILNCLKEFNIVKTFKTTQKYIIDKRKKQNDFNKLRKYINSCNPNYIICTHYELLDVIPKDKLSITMHEIHTSFKASFSHKATRKALLKYNNKVKYIWLTKATCDAASKNGINNNYYIYNAVRFISNSVANVIENKKLITIARLDDEKRIDLMINIVKEIFKDRKYKDWVLEIYGTGNNEEKLKKLINNNNQILLMGFTDSPKEKYLDSSINLNTSSFEGFNLSILEANECGVPTVTFNFGESVYEEILANKTGIIIEHDNINSYKNELENLMKDNNKLLELSKNCKEFSNNFKIENIISKWTDIFKEIDYN